MENEYLEMVWNGLLSRDNEQIRDTFELLDDQSRKVVLEHLNRMISEDGWQPGQVESAQCALQVLGKNQIS